VLLLAIEADDVLPSSRVPFTPFAVNVCAINVCAVKAGSGSFNQGGCHPGGNVKVWRWWEPLDAVATKVWRQR
jgi:hypothetical protein